jgi:hypothetical protein
MSERSELDVMVFSSPRSGEAVTGARRARDWQPRRHDEKVHQ